MTRRDDASTSQMAKFRVCMADQVVFVRMADYELLVCMADQELFSSFPTDHWLNSWEATFSTTLKHEVGRWGQLQITSRSVRLLHHEVMDQLSNLSAEHLAAPSWLYIVNRIWIYDSLYDMQTLQSTCSGSSKVMSKDDSSFDML